MYNSLRLTLVLALGFLLNCPSASAGQDLVVRQPLKVYAERKERSSVLRELDRGDRVPVSPTKYGNWRKLRLRVGGEWRDGWIRDEDMKGALVVARDNDPLAARGPVFHQNYALGGVLILSQVNQGSQKSATTDTNPVPYSESALSGFTTFFGLSGLIPLSKGLALNPEILFRQLNVTGTVQVGGSPVVPLQLTESYVGGAMILRSYFADDGDWWWGGGIEISYGSQPTVTYGNGQPLAISGGSSTYNIFLLTAAAVGVDLHLAGSFYVMPDLRVGYVPLFSPGALVAESHVAVVYSFE